MTYEHGRLHKIQSVDNDPFKAISEDTNQNIWALTSHHRVFRIKDRIPHEVMSLSGLEARRLFWRKRRQTIVQSVVFGATGIALIVGLIGLVSALKGVPWGKLSFDNSILRSILLYAAGAFGALYLRRTQKSRFAYPKKRPRSESFRVEPPSLRIRRLLRSVEPALVGAGFIAAVGKDIIGGTFSQQLILSFVIGGAAALFFRNVLTVDRVPPDEDYKVRVKRRLP